MKKPKIIVIIGPTASGKSNLAVRLASEFNGEIISADSVQVYKDLNIGSAKVTQKEMNGIKHYNLDVLEPNVRNSAGEFCEKAHQYIEEILSKNKMPIIVGGTTLYVKALLDGYNFYNAKTTFDNDEWRKEMSNKYSPEEIYNLLKKSNPDLAEKVHPNNTKRVLRYLQIAQENNINKKQIELADKYDILTINLQVDREILYERINNRVDEMIKEGLIDETKNITKKYGTYNLPGLESIGYKEIVKYLKNELPLDEAISLIKQHTRNYAKKQITFIKKLKSIPIEYTTKNYEVAQNIVKEFIYD